jgi:hypothetical protein
MYGCGVGPEYDVRVEHREKRIEVTAARCGEEGEDHFAQAVAIGIGNRARCPPAGVRGSRVSWTRSACDARWERSRRRALPPAAGSTISAK